MKPIELYARSVRRVLSAAGHDPNSVRVITTAAARYMGTPCLHDHVIVSDRQVALYPDHVQVGPFTIGLAGVPTHGIVARGGDVAIALT